MLSIRSKIIGTSFLMLVIVSTLWVMNQLTHQAFHKEQQFTSKLSAIHTHSSQLVFLLLNLDKSSSTIGPGRIQKILSLTGDISQQIQEADLLTRKNSNYSKFAKNLSSLKIGWEQLRMGIGNLNLATSSLIPTNSEVIFRLGESISKFQFAQSELIKILSKNQSTPGSRVQFVGTLLFITATVLFLLTLPITRVWTSAINTLFDSLASLTSTTSDLSVQSKEKFKQIEQGHGQEDTHLDEVLSGMREMEGSVSKTVKKASTAQAMATSVKLRTEESSKVIAKLVESMQSIQQANSNLSTISDIISEISGKTNVVNQIVFKTQLLSFNASIEAARSGHHGRGFAVVAEEVGNLAKMSGVAAKEISDLLEDSKLQVGRILTHTQETVNRGKNVTTKVAGEFKEMRKDVGSILEEINGVHSHCTAQSRSISRSLYGLKRMGQAMHLAEKGASEALQLTAQTHHFSGDLENIAERLHQLTLGTTRRKNSQKEAPADILLNRKQTANEGKEKAS